MGLSGWASDVRNGWKADIKHHRLVISFDAEVVVSLFNRLFGATPRDPADQLIGWLGDKSLDDRRIVVGILYGGPHSLKVNKWVLSQPDCDKGTASMLLWEFGSPQGLIRGLDRFPVNDEVKRELIAFITARWRRGLFAPAVFEFDGRENRKVYRRELKKKGLEGRDPFNLPEEAWQPIKGRRPAGSPAVARRAGSKLDHLLSKLRLADLAAADPGRWKAT
jgi:hypothetical protein